MKEIMNHKVNIWWKLAIVSLVINILAYPGWVFMEFVRSPIGFPFPLYWIIVFRVLFAIPLIYFFVFGIWHWHTRYAGRQPLIWPILFVFTYWPNVYATIPGSFFIVVAYYFIHIIPDIRGKGVYASIQSFTSSAPTHPLPKSYQLVKSSCFVIGLALIIFGILVATMSCVSHFIIWNIFAGKVPELVGRPFTENISEALLVAVDTSKISVVTSLLAAISSAVGAILLYVSQQIRWRLLDEQQKEELKRNI